MLILLLLSSLALAKQQPKPKFHAKPVVTEEGQAPSVLAEPSYADMLKVVEGLRAENGKANAENDRIGEELTIERGQHTKTAAELLSAKGESAELQRQIVALRDYGDAEHAGKIEAQSQVKIERKAREIAEAHVSKIKTYLGFALGALLALAVEYLLASLPPLGPYAFWIRIGAPIAAFAIGWAIVARVV